MLENTVKSPHAIRKVTIQFEEHTKAIRNSFVQNMFL